MIDWHIDLFELHCNPVFRRDHTPYFHIFFQLASKSKMARSPSNVYFFLHILAFFVKFEHFHECTPRHAHISMDCTMHGNKKKKNLPRMFIFIKVFLCRLETSRFMSRESFGSTFATDLLNSPPPLPHCTGLPQILKPRFCPRC